MRNLLKGKFPALAVLAMSFPVQALSAPLRADTMGGDWHDGWGWGHMFFGSIMMLLFWGGLVILIVLAVRWMGTGSPRGGNGRGPDNRALDILEERYARGEIDQEEFEERRRLLSK